MCLITMSDTESKVLKKDKVVWKLVDLDIHTGKAYPLLHGVKGFGYWPGVTMYQPIRMYDPNTDFRPSYADAYEVGYFSAQFGMRGIESVRPELLLREGHINAWTEGFHFYETKKRARCSDIIRLASLCRFVIPKGTKIILSGNGVGIAEAITYSPLSEKEKKKGK